MQAVSAVVVLSAQIEAHASGRRELVQALLEWVAAAGRETGAERVHVYEDLESAPRFLAVSAWTDIDAMTTHLRGAAFGVMMGALDAVGAPAVFSIARQEGGNAADSIRTLRRLGNTAAPPALAAALSPPGILPSHPGATDGPGSK